MFALNIKLICRTRQRHRRLAAHSLLADVFSIVRHMQVLFLVDLFRETLEVESDGFELGGGFSV